MVKVTKREYIETTNNEVDNSQETVSKKAAGYSVVDQTVFLLLGLVEFFLFTRFVFRLAGANPGTPIVRLIYAISNVLMEPYRFIFPTTQVEGTVFDWSVLVAMLFYLLFAWIIIKLMGIFFTASSASE